MGEWNTNLRVWLSGRWEQLITVNVSDEEDARKGRLFNILMVISIGITAALSLIFLVMPSLSLLATRVSLIAGAFPFFFIPLSIFCLVQTRLGRIQAMIYFYVWTNFYAISLAAFVFDGIHSPAWLLYIWTITIAGTLLTPGYALWMTGLMVAYFLLLLLLQRAGLYTPLMNLGPEGLEFANISFRIIMIVSTVGLLTYLNMRSLKETLSSLLTTKKALEEHRRSLEQHTTALAETNEKLLDRTNKLERQNREIGLLGEMGNLMQSCQSLEEASAVLTRFMKQLFPDNSGALFAFRSSRNLLMIAAFWGKISPKEMIFDPKDCWAIRQGQDHCVKDAATGMKCGHVGDTVETYLCIPMIAQGEVLGLLNLMKNPGDMTQSGEKWVEENQHIARSVAKQIGLALGNIKLRETLRELSVSDPLTGLFNRRFMEEFFVREFMLAKRKDTSIGIIMLDIDHFKHYNDTFGHEVGDDVLRELGSLLRKSIRGSDIACRYGGDEFVLILPEASLAVTLERVEHIREEVKHLDVGNANQPMETINISAGVAVFPDHGETSEIVLHAADIALYQAKKAGRNQVCVSGLDGGVNTKCDSIT